jgi:hypothetical protein
MYYKTLPCFLFFVALFFTNAGALSPPDSPNNTIQCQGVTGLNFGAAGNNVQIALFIINSNTTTAFDLTFQFANGCKFKYRSGEIPMTALVLNKVSGTLGIGLTEPDHLDVLDNLPGGQYLWDPGAAQTTPTVNYIVELRGSWANPAGKLAGFYYETITVTFTVGL